MSDDNEPPIHEYLGDGAYVTWNGYALEVKANDHLNPTDTVTLGQHEITALVRFAKRVGMLPEEAPNADEA